MNNETLYDREYDGESFSETIERDARRYNRAFTEEEEVGLL